MKTVAVTAGYITPTAARPSSSTMDAANVDLKGFSEEFYRKLTDCAPGAGAGNPPLAGPREQHLAGNHQPDHSAGERSAEEIERMCRWIVEDLGPGRAAALLGVSSRFQLSDRAPTLPETLAAAYDVARRAGLNYVYTGNVSDHRRQTTYCPGCGQV